jgi:hypothetical protein
MFVEQAGQANVVLVNETINFCCRLGDERRINKVQSESFHVDLLDGSERNLFSRSYWAVSSNNNVNGQMVTEKARNSTASNKIVRRAGDY